MFDCMADANGSSCKNCVNQHCTSDFETCSGLTPPSNALLGASAACMDSADQAVWNKDGKTKFQSSMSTCGNKCLGTESCTSKCIEDELKYTTACSDCFGSLVSCTKDHCMFDCMADANGSSCKNCVDQHCTSAFETCSGLTPPSNALLGASAACMDSADQAVWNKDGKTKFQSSMSTCGNKCLG